MKTNKIAIILGLFLLPALICAQENKTQEKVNNVVTQVTESGVTFTVPDIDLDSVDIEVIKQAVNKEVSKIHKRERCTSSDLKYNYKGVNVLYRNVFATYLEEEVFDYDDAIPYDEAIKNIDTSKYEYERVTVEDIAGPDIDEVIMMKLAWVHKVVTSPGYWAYLYERMDGEESANSKIPPFIIVYVYEGDQLDLLANTYTIEYQRPTWIETNEGKKFFSFWSAGLQHVATTENDRTIILVVRDEDFRDFNDKVNFANNLPNFEGSIQDIHFAEEQCGDPNLRQKDYSLRNHIHTVIKVEITKGIIEKQK